MVKYFLRICFATTLAVLGLLSMSSADAAFNTVQFPQDTNIYVTSTGITIVVKGGSEVAGLTVFPTYFVVDLEKDASGASSITLRSNDRYLLTNNGIINTVCEANYSSVVLNAPDQVGAKAVNVTPEATVCAAGTSGAVGSSGGGGGGGGGGGADVSPPNPTMPQTTSGQVTATASGGGKTSLTTTEGTVTVQVPANIVTGNTAFQISPVAASQVVSSSPPPSGYSMVGSNAYSFTAIQGTSNLTVFTSPVTLTFTYTDAQIAGLDEGSLTVYRWNGTAWEALSGTVNRSSNTITVTTTKFSYFAIFGKSLSAIAYTPTVVATTIKPISQMTVAELKAKIIEIIAMIGQLQVELQKMLAKSPFNTDFSYGSTRTAEVKRLQEFLISKGYLAAGLNTGRYYAATQAAIKAYQKAKGLLETGAFDAAARTAVNKELGL